MDSFLRAKRTLKSLKPFEFEDIGKAIPSEEPRSWRPADSGPFFYSRSSNARRSLAMNLGVELTATGGATSSDSRAGSKPMLDHIDVYWKATTITCVRNLVAVSIGKNVMDLPYAMALCGFLPGLFFLIVLGIQNLFFMHRVLEAPQVLRRHLVFFEDIAMELFGICGFRIVAFCNVLALFGFMLKVFEVEVVSAGKHISYLASKMPGPNEEKPGFKDFNPDKMGWFEMTVLVPVLTLLLIPFAFRTSAKALAVNGNVSFLAVRMIVVALISLSIYRIWEDRGNADWGNQWINFNIKDQLRGLSIFVYSTFLGPMLLPAVLSDMLKPEDARQVCNRVVQEGMVMYVLVACTGFLAYARVGAKDLVTGDTKGMRTAQESQEFLDVLSPGGNIFTHLVRVFFTLTNFTAFPLLFCPWRRLIESLLSMDMEPPVDLSLPWALRRLIWKKRVLRCLLILLFPVFYILMNYVQSTKNSRHVFDSFFGYSLVMPLVTGIYLFPAIFTATLWARHRPRETLILSGSSFCGSVFSAAPSLWINDRSSSIIEAHSGVDWSLHRNRLGLHDGRSHISSDSHPSVPHTSPRSHAASSTALGELPPHWMKTHTSVAFVIDIELPPDMASREAKHKKADRRDKRRTMASQGYHFPALWQYISDFDDEVSLLAPARTRRGYILVGISALSAVAIWLAVVWDLVKSEHALL